MQRFCIFCSARFYIAEGNGNENKNDSYGDSRYEFLRREIFFVDFHEKIISSEAEKCRVTKFAGAEEYLRF